MLKKGILKRLVVGIGLFSLLLSPLKAQEKSPPIVDAAFGKTFGVYYPNSIMKQKTNLQGIVAGIYVSNTKARIGYFVEFKTKELEMNKPRKVPFVMLKVGLDYNYFINKMSKIKAYAGLEASYNEIAYMDETRHITNGIAISPKVGVDIPLIRNKKLKLSLEGKAEMLKLKQYSKMKSVSVVGKVRF